MGFVAIKTKELHAKVSRRGPFGVDTGDLGFTGIPGAIFVPRGAPSPAPIVGWAHDWTKGPQHYTDTLKHLASWGFVVVAPSTDHGPRPSHQMFADHLSAAIENTLQSTLGRGSVRADPRRIALAGHGLGGGVAALLASQRTDIDAVAMVFPSETVPSAAERASLIDAPGLLIEASGGTFAEDARDLHVAWRGELVHRRLEKAIEILDRGGLSGPPSRFKVGYEPRDGEACGLVEAPRGPLIHHYVVQHGDIARAKFLNPTQHSLLSIEHALGVVARRYITEGGIHAELEAAIGRVVRAFDPCIACATH